MYGVDGSIEKELHGTRHHHRVKARHTRQRIERTTGYARGVDPPRASMNAYIQRTECGFVRVTEKEDIHPLAIGNGPCSERVRSEPRIEPRGGRARRSHRAQSQKGGEHAYEANAHVSSRP